MSPRTLKISHYDYGRIAALAKISGQGLVYTVIGWFPNPEHTGYTKPGKQTLNGTAFSVQFYSRVNPKSWLAFHFHPLPLGPSNYDMPRTACQSRRQVPIKRRGFQPLVRKWLTHREKKRHFGLKVCPKGIQMGNL